ncbi:MAG: hypothetical protein ACI9OJ_002764 [Myxococcota bacterium]|jgi:hypothetical protein
MAARRLTSCSLTEWHSADFAPPAVRLDGSCQAPGTPAFACVPWGPPRHRAVAPPEGRTLRCNNALWRGRSVVPHGDHSGQKGLRPAQSGPTVYGQPTD